MLLGLVLTFLLALFFWPGPASGTGLVKIRLLTVTNEAGGETLAVFCVTNGTKRLFVRGRSQIEVQGNGSNEVRAVQLRKVDYLKPRQSIVFSVRTPAAGGAWRLNFLYLGQLSLLERLKEGMAWQLYDRGIPISEKKLRLTPVCDVTTRWIND